MHAFKADKRLHLKPMIKLWMTSNHVMIWKIQSPNQKVCSVWWKENSKQPRRMTKSISRKPCRRSKVPLWWMLSISTQPKREPLIFRWHRWQSHEWQWWCQTKWWWCLVLRWALLSILIWAWVFRDLLYMDNQCNSRSIWDSHRWGLTSLCRSRWWWHKDQWYKLE